MNEWLLIIGTILWLVGCFVLTVSVYRLVRALKSAKVTDNLEKYYEDM